MGQYSTDMSSPGIRCHAHSERMTYFTKIRDARKNLNVPTVYAFTVGYTIDKELRC